MYKSASRNMQRHGSWGAHPDCGSLPEWLKNRYADDYGFSFCREQKFEFESLGDWGIAEPSGSLPRVTSKYRSKVLGSEA